MRVLNSQSNASVAPNFAYRCSASVKLVEVYVTVLTIQLRYKYNVDETYEAKCEL